MAFICLPNFRCFQWQNGNFKFGTQWTQNMKIKIRIEMEWNNMTRNHAKRNVAHFWNIFHLNWTQKPIYNFCTQMLSTNANNVKLFARAPPPPPLHPPPLYLCLSGCLWNILLVFVVVVVCWCKHRTAAHDTPTMIDISC